MTTDNKNQPKINVEKSPEQLAKEARVTKEDLKALGSKSGNLTDDGGDDEQLLARKRKVDFAGDDLDVPGSELDDAQERIGSEDEENNSYSDSNEKED
jgi:hypothetical protein